MVSLAYGETVQILVRRRTRRWPDVYVYIPQEDIMVYWKDWRVTRRGTHPVVVDLEEMEDGRVLVTMVYVVSAEFAKMMVKAQARDELHIGVPFYYYEECQEELGSDKRQSKKPRKKAKEKRSDTFR
jgi:hypothetical protein